MVLSGDPSAFLNYKNKESNLKNDKTKGPDKILVGTYWVDLRERRWNHQTGKDATS